MELHPQTVKDAVAQIEKCNFECEAGPMANNGNYILDSRYFLG